MGFACVQPILRVRSVVKPNVRRSAITGVSVHVSAKDGVDPALISAFAAEPFEEVGIQSHRNGFLWPRHDHACRLPEHLVGWLGIGIIDDRGAYLVIGDRAEPTPIGFRLSCRGIQCGCWWPIAQT